MSLGATAAEPLVLGIETSCDETGVGTVSYTHLDVYKRQSFFFSNGKMRNSMSTKRNNPCQSICINIVFC